MMTTNTTTIGEDNRKPRLFGGGGTHTHTHTFSRPITETFDLYSGAMNTVSGACWEREGSKVSISHRFKH